MANDQLFIDVLAQIEREPKKWKQTHWKYPMGCGTAMCFAGWACTLAKVEVLGEARDVYTLNGVHVSQAARELLGITYEDAGGADPQTDQLFCGENGLDDLYRISARITGLDEQVLRDKVRDQLDG